MKHEATKDTENINQLKLIPTEDTENINQLKLITTDKFLKNRITNQNKKIKSEYKAKNILSLYKEAGLITPDELLKKRLAMQNEKKLKQAYKMKIKNRHKKNKIAAKTRRANRKKNN